MCCTAYPAEGEHLRMPTLGAVPRPAVLSTGSMRCIPAVDQHLVDSCRLCSACCPAYAITVVVGNHMGW